MQLKRNEILEAIDSTILIHKNEDVEKYIYKYIKKMRCLKIISILVLILILICISEFKDSHNMLYIIKNMFLIIEIIIVGYYFFCKKQFGQKINNLLKQKNDINLYIKVTYERIKYVKYKRNMKILIVYFFNYLMAAGKIDEAYEIAKKINFDKSEAWQFIINCIAVCSAFNNNDKEKYMQFINKLFGMKIINKCHYNKIFNELIKQIKNNDKDEESYYSKTIKINEQKKKNSKHRKIVILLICIIAATIIVCGFVIYKSINSLFNMNMYKTVAQIQGMNLKESDYYLSVEEAVMCDFKDKNTKPNILKVIKKDDNCKVLIFYDMSYGVINSYDLKIKEKNGQIYYSRPISILSVNQYIANKHFNGDSNTNKELVDLVRSDIKYCVNINSNTNTDNGLYIIGGLTEDESICNLKINNTAPDEIITLQYKNEKYYFWYYENLDIKENDMDNLNISF